MKNLLTKPKISIQEAVFAIVVAGFIVNSMFAYADIVIHDNYVLPLIADCKGSEQNDTCLKIRQEQGCAIDSDSECIGQRYWVLLPQMVFAISGGVAIGVMFFRILGGAKPNGMLLLIGFAWFITGIILPYTGWGDFTYYLIKGETLPETLPWLNNAGFFPYFTDNVTQMDLLLVMGFGVLLLFILWYGLTHLNKKYLKLK